MKLNDTLLYGALLFGGIALAVFFLYGKFTKQADADAKAELNQWVESTMAAKLAAKLSASPEAVRKALTETSSAASDSELSQKARALIGKVEVIFTQNSASGVARSLEAQLTDGTSISLTSQMQWDNLPAEIRSQFIGSGQKSVRIPWKYAT